MPTDNFAAHQADDLTAPAELAEYTQPADFSAPAENAENTQPLIPQSELEIDWLLVETEKQLLAAVADLARYSGMFAIDAERASGYRYFNSAYLVQVKRSDSPIYLFDPVAVKDFEPLAKLLNSEGWILHSGRHDLACLEELGLKPPRVWDTEVAATLLKLPRIGLGKLVADLLGIELDKAHSAEDWSERPLPDEWLDYAAIDVEFLQEIKDILTAQAVESGRTDLLEKEFEKIRCAEPKPARIDPWRRVSGIQAVQRDNRALNIVRELWQARDAYGREHDIAPYRVLPDRCILAAATVKPRSEDGLLRMRNFRGGEAKTESALWWQAIKRGKASEDNLVRRRPVPPHLRRKQAPESAEN
ncbi:MAG: HRDC domain-containing protein [Microbacteriaceae bacterium]|nr:HRDC domain-containing protein [Microbacteriaceae bacterium]